MALSYRPEIDGLRAVAVLVVVLYHAHFGFSGGYVGVDVFFVISGFLITSLIRKEIFAGQFTLAGFWERRIRRILPAMALNVVVVLIASLFVLLPKDLEELAKSSAAVSLLSSNFFFWADGDYFAGPAELKPLLHTWSLAVEEQFYLGFPLLMLFCRRFRQSRMVFLLVTIALGSFAFNVWGSYSDRPETRLGTFYLLPTRIWELLIGALLVFVPPPAKLIPSVRQSLSWIGLIGIGVASLTYDDTTRFPGIAALVPCCGAALIIYAESSELTVVGKLLSKEPLLTIGRFSYSLYLWHWPILALLRYQISENLSVSYRIMAVGLSLVAGYLSWRYVETPFRRRSTEQSPRRRPVFTAALATSTLLLGSSVFIWRAEGLPSRFSKEVLRVAEGTELQQPDPVRQFQQLHGGKLVPLGPPFGPDQPPKFLLWGDSHALAIKGVMNDLAKTYDIPGYYAARPGTVPLLETWRIDSKPETIEWNQGVLDFIKAERIKNVFLVARWVASIDGLPDGRMFTLIEDQESTTSSPEESKNALRRGLKRTLDELEQIGATVWILEQVPLQKENPILVLSRSAAQPDSPAPKGVSLEEHRTRQANTKAVFDEFTGSNVHVLDPADFCFDSSGHSLIGGKGRSYYSDQHHLSPLGADALLRKVFEPILARMTPSQHPTEQASQ
jgi:peptidoglycan/LPS O-acetylase OafA/YrhL